MTLLSDTLKQYWGYDSFKGMQKEAFKILEDWYGELLDETKRNKIISQINYNQIESNDIGLIFKNNMMKLINSFLLILCTNFLQLNHVQQYL